MTQFGGETETSVCLAMCWMTELSNVIFHVCNRHRRLTSRSRTLLRRCLSVFSQRNMGTSFGICL